MTQSAQKLQEFRSKAYQLLGRAKDATFDLMDAVLVTRNIYSFAELSLSPVFRRKWSSLYEALDDCRPNRHKLMKLYLGEIPSKQRPIVAGGLLRSAFGEHTPWARTEAPTLKDRTYEHGAKVISGKPITLGHGYSTLAWIPEDKGSWALPLRHERITSFETPISKGAFQLRQVCKHIPERPISLWDSEYGCAKFVKLTADIEADKLMRLRPNRCVFGEPGAYPGKGRPKKHGHKMKLSDPTTWEIPVESIEIDDPTWGRVEIKRWSQFHFYDSADHPMEIILIQRQGKGLSKKAAKPMWLAWIGEEKLSLEALWQHYLRRFAIEHWNRFLKQRLHWRATPRRRKTQGNARAWTKAKLGTTEKGQRWSDLMTIATWQLWLAREIIEDNPLPWQKPQPQEKLTPGRVAQSFSILLVAIGTPALSPKPRGKSPGWQKGKIRTKKTRFPIAKKGKGRFESQKKAKKESKSA